MSSKQELIYRINMNTQAKFTKYSNNPYDETVFIKFIKFCLYKGLLNEKDLINIIGEKKLLNILQNKKR